jgi:hypothetical protein
MRQETVREYFTNPPVDTPPAEEVDDLDDVPSLLDDVLHGAT